MNAHVMWWSHCSGQKSWSEQWQPQGRPKFVTAHTVLPQGWVWHISVSARQQSWHCGHCWQNLHRPFLRAILPMTVGSGAQAVADNRKTNGLRIPPLKWETAQLYYSFESVHDGNHDSVVRIFTGLSCNLWGSLITYITLFYIPGV